MARARNRHLDYYQNFRFHIQMEDGSRFASARGDAGLTGAPDAGFSTCSAPELNLETVEYREGHYIYTRKQPGIPSFNNLTFSRGVTRADSTFWNWIVATTEGDGSYRETLVIKHFHRDAQMTVSAFRGRGSDDNAVSYIDIQSDKHRTYRIKEAFPNRCKLTSDLDATSSDIAITELDVAYEKLEVENAPIEQVQLF